MLLDQPLIRVGKDLMDHPWPMKLFLGVKYPFAKISTEISNNLIQEFFPLLNCTYCWVPPLIYNWSVPKLTGLSE